MTLDRDAFRAYLRSLPGAYRLIDPLVAWVQHACGTADVATGTVHIWINGRRQILPQWAQALEDRLLERKPPVTVDTAVSVLDDIHFCDRCGELLPEDAYEWYGDPEIDPDAIFCEECFPAWREGKLENCAAMKTAPWD